MKVLKGRDDILRFECFTSNFLHIGLAIVDWRLRQFCQLAEKAREGTVLIIGNLLIAKDYDKELLEGLHHLVTNRPI